MSIISTPQVSIIVPIYNVEKFLSRCLDSVIGQTMSDIEIILVNDASPDDSLKIAQEYADRDSRIQIIDKTVNEGPMMARHTGINAARAERVFFLDSDDYIPLNAIEQLYNAAQTTNADIVVGNMYLENLQGRHVLKPRAHVAGPDGDAYLRAILSWTTCSLCGALFRRSIMLDPSLPAFKNQLYSEDRILLTAILITVKPVVATVNIDAYYYCLNQASTTRVHLSDDRLRDQLKALSYCHEYLETKTSNYSRLNDNFLLRYLSLLIEKGSPRDIVVNYNDTTRRLLQFRVMKETTSLRFAIHTWLATRSSIYCNICTTARQFIRKLQGKD